jgi:High potential iron-sulfur protein
MLGQTALFGIAFATTGVAFGAEKMTREQAQYQDQPKGISMCATCTLFEPPRSCKVVEGDVSPNGWCKAFALAD